MVRVVLRLERRGDRPVRSIPDLLEHAIDRRVRLVHALGIDGPLVVQPEECAVGDAVRHDERRHLRLGVREPLERAGVHDRRADVRGVDVRGGEVERLGDAAALAAQRQGEGLVVGGDGRVEGVVAEGEVDAGVAVGGRGDAVDDT